MHLKRPAIKSYRLSWRKAMPVLKYWAVCKQLEVLVEGYQLMRVVAK